MCNMKSREDLFIEQINEKREEAYHELFKEFYRSLVLFAMRYIEEQEEAEDIIQELFVAGRLKRDIEIIPSAIRRIQRMILK